MTTNVTTNETIRPPTLDRVSDPARLRRVLWEHHGHDGIYGDDGEMQCNRYPPADFRRDHIDALIAHVAWTPLSTLASR